MSRHHHKQFQIAVNIDALLHQHDTRKEFETVSQRTAESSYAQWSDDDSATSYDSSDSDDSINDNDFYEELQAWMKSITTVKRQPARGGMRRTTSMHLMGAKNTMPKYKEQINHHPLVESRMKKCNATFFQSPEQLETARKDKKDSTMEKPQDRLKAIFAAKGIADISRLEPRNSDFLPVSDERVADHSKELTDAARRVDLKMLREFFRSGKNLQACNRFGESIVHIMCRRGSAEGLSFLLQKAKCSLMVRDDCGKNPLHDAMWTDKPSFEMVKILLGAAPRLLFAKDNRGWTPLAYIPRQQWADWTNFLNENEALVLTAAL